MLPPAASGNGQLIGAVGGLQGHSVCTERGYQLPSLQRSVFIIVGSTFASAVIGYQIEQTLTELHFISQGLERRLEQFSRKQSPARVS
jgi:hypothetical protein